MSESLFDYIPAPGKMYIPEFSTESYKYYNRSADTFHTVSHPSYNLDLSHAKDIVINVPIAAASVDQHAYCADDAYYVVSVSEIHTVAGNDSGAVTADVVVVDDEKAPSDASATSVLSSALNLKSTANTRVNATLSSTAADLNIVSGQQLSINFTGTLTNLAGGVITIRLRKGTAA